MGLLILLGLRSFMYVHTGLGGCSPLPDSELPPPLQCILQALVKFNESLAMNKNLRERIDTLRRERVVFDSIYKKLERELHEKKKVRRLKRSERQGMELGNN